MRVLWKVSRLDLTWPSVRVRALTPTLLLRERGFDITVTDRRPSEDDLRGFDAVVISKSFSDDDLWLSIRTKELRKALIVDLCDDLFGAKRDVANAEAFRQQTSRADVITTTGEVLRDTIARQVNKPDRIVIVPDHAETLALTRALVATFPPDRTQRTQVYGARTLHGWWRKLIGRERALKPGRKMVIWFGMAGLPGQGTGIDALAAIAPQLNAVDREIPFQLLIVSTAYGRVARAAKTFTFPWAFRDWALLPAYKHVASADVCVIPNPQTPYAIAKSPNRALLSLSAGTPVVASGSPAYAPLGKAIVTDDWEGGLRRYLTDPVAVEADLAAAREVIDRMFAPALIRDRWADLLTQVLRQACRPSS